MYFTTIKDTCTHKKAARIVPGRMCQGAQDTLIYLKNIAVVLTKQHQCKYYLI